MPFDAHANLAQSTVDSPPSPADSGTSLTVVDASDFPAVPFSATISPADSSATLSNAEIVRVTDITGDTITIEREQEGTTARIILAGDRVRLTETAKTFTDIEGAISSVSSSLANHLGLRLSYTENFPLKQAGIVLVGNILSTGATAASAAANPF